MTHAWSAVLGWTLATVGSLTAIPQIVRLARTRAVEGLAATTEMMWIPSWALWLWYVLAERIGPRMVSESLGLCLSLVTVSLLMTNLARRGQAGAALRAAAPLLTVSTTAILVARGLWGLDGMAIALTLSDAAALVPLVRTTLTSRSLAGVSVWAWVLRLATYSGWVAYAIAIGQPLSAGWMYLMLPVAVLRLACLARDRHTFGWGGQTRRGAGVASSDDPTSVSALNRAR